jgi:hypothetical protein
MSDVVGGGVSRGKGNNQVTIAFVGKCSDAKWAEFVQCVVKCAAQAGIGVGGVAVKNLSSKPAAKKKAAKKKAAKKK